jgi:hypothetical protein
MKNEIDFAELLQKSGSKEWNEAIASRLESMRVYLSQDEWKKGIDPYLRGILANGIQKMLGEKCEVRDVDYLRGMVACAKIILALPGSVEGQIAAEQGKQMASKDRGAAGY